MMPLSPSTTFSTSGVSGRFVNTTSTCEAISAGEPPAFAPSATSSSTDARERLLTMMGNPAFMMLRAMDLPMIPSPMYPIFSMIREIISPVRLEYGTNGLDVKFPADRLTVIEPIFVPANPDPGGALASAIRSPIGRPPLRELYRKGQTVGISGCDITRAQPRQIMVEALISEMPGVRMEDITVFIATGTHRANSPAEIEKMLGTEIARRCRIICHNARDDASLTLVGKTTTGAPVFLNREWL